MSQILVGQFKKQNKKHYDEFYRNITKYLSINMILHDVNDQYYITAPLLDIQNINNLDYYIETKNLYNHIINFDDSDIFIHNL